MITCRIRNTDDLINVPRIPETNAYDFDSCNLEDANLEGANLQGARFISGFYF